MIELRGNIMIGTGDAPCVSVSTAAFGPDAKFHCENNLMVQLSGLSLWERIKVAAKVALMIVRHANSSDGSHIKG